jgi:hypothetical protein
MRVRRQIGVSLLLAALGLGLVGVSGASAGADGVKLNHAQAAKALHRVSRLLGARKHRVRHRRPPRELTSTLSALSRSLSSLGPVERRHAATLLARPTDSPDPDGSSYQVGEQPPLCSAHFCVHYVASTVDAPDLTDANGNGIPDYVETVAAVAEAVYAVENGTLGWKPPKPDGSLGDDSRVDIYLVQLGGTQAFGYTATDLGQHKRSEHSYLVLDDDFAASEFGVDPLVALQVTLAHEYNHVLQFSLDAAEDTWFQESTAVWMEDHVYPTLNDYLRYIKRWVVRTKVPLTDARPPGGIKIYGSAVFNHWLAGRYGDSIIRTAWEQARKLRPAGFAVATYNKAIRKAGGKDLAHEFAQFAAATAEWRTPGVFPYSDAPLWQDVQRRGVLHPGRFTIRPLSHTGYLLFRVRHTRAKAVRLLAGAEKGTEAAFALICRQGPPEIGTVRIKEKFTKRGGVRGVTLRHPGRCSRITAALINADPRQIGFAFGDWLYTHDHRRFAATLVLRR